ncbi:MAG: hypothetical protein AAFZ38_07170 [Myxococcota bacterium]
MNLKEKPFKLTLYFRALERAPGGNLEEFTVKQVLNHRPSQGPTLEGAAYINTDGEHALARFDFSKNAASNLDPVIESVEKLLESGVSRSSREIPETGDEYDTAWSSIEIALDVDGDRRLEFVQNAVQSVSHPPSAEETSLIERCLNLAGLNRPMTLVGGADGGCPLNTHWPTFEWTELGWLEEPVPLYLEQPE